MKLSRNWLTAGAMTVLALAGGAGLVALSELDGARLTTGHRDTVAADRIRANTARRPLDTADAPPEHSTGLQVDDAMDLDVDHGASAAADAGSKDSDIASNGVDAAMAGDFVEDQPAHSALNLRMPEDSNKLDSAEHQAASQQAVREPAPEPSPLALATGTGDAPTPHVESFNLFNPEYGLRGFMKQSWINQRVAFQGGFGLDDDRINKSKQDDNFRDNIAVGMGVILAF